MSEEQQLDSFSPKGPLEQRWTQHKYNLRVVSPANRKRYRVIVVGTGLAGASAAASLAEMGYQVKPSAFRTVLEELTALPRRAALMPPKIIIMMAIVSGDCFTT